MSIYWEFGRPCIMATDLDFIKQVQVTAFDHFSEGYLIPDDYLKVIELKKGCELAQQKVIRFFK